MIEINEDIALSIIVLSWNTCDITIRCIESVNANPPESAPGTNARPHRIADRTVASRRAASVSMSSVLQNANRISFRPSSGFE